MHFFVSCGSCSCNTPVLYRHRESSDVVGESLENLAIREARMKWLIKVKGHHTTAPPNTRTHTYTTNNATHTHTTLTHTSHHTPAARAPRAHTRTGDLIFRLIHRRPAPSPTSCTRPSTWPSKWPPRGSGLTCSGELEPSRTSSESVLSHIVQAFSCARRGVNASSGACVEG